MLRLTPAFSSLLLVLTSASLGCGDDSSGADTGPADTSVADTGAGDGSTDSGSDATTDSGTPDGSMDAGDAATDAPTDAPADGGDGGAPTCYTQTPIAVDPEAGPVMQVFDTALGAADTIWRRVSCGASIDTSGNEVIYSFTLTAAATLRFTVTPIEPASSDFGVYIRTECEETLSQVACSQHSGTDPTSFTAGLDAGTHFVFVDDYDPTTDTPQTFRIEMAIE